MVSTVPGIDRSGRCHPRILLTATILCRRPGRKAETKQVTVELKVCKAAYSTVVHLDRSCPHLRRSKKIEEWPICKDCAKSKLKLD